MSTTRWMWTRTSRLVPTECLPYDCQHEPSRCSVLGDREGLAGTETRNPQLTVKEAMSTEGYTV